MYTDLEIQQVQATCASKIALQGYSRALKDSYGMNNCAKEFKIGCLLLFQFALGNWNNAPGASNPFDNFGLNSIIRRINSL